MPFFGGLVVEYQLALISQLFSTLFRNDISMKECLDIASEGATNIHYKESITDMKEKVSSGTTLSDAMRNYPKLYPKNFISIVAVGERSGTLDGSFEYLSEFYTREVDAKTKRLPGIIEPVLLVFLGIIIGFVALAIILPIYQLTGSFSR